METRNLVGGEWVESSSGESTEIRNPANDEIIAEVPKCGAEETIRALDAAAEALPDWSRRPAEERSKILVKFADLMMRDQDRLARIMTNEQGKPLKESSGEIAYAADFIRWAGEEAKRVYGETIPASSKDKRILVLRQPVGVCVSITPWNFPAAMITRKLGPALAAGCVMVSKPAEQTPLSAIALGELAIEAGVPAGVFGIVTGDAETIVDAMIQHDATRKLSFTGSTEVGRTLMKKCAERIVRVSLELGGHAPLIVFDDADLDTAVEGCVASKFRNAGQTCVCANRIYVQSGVYEEFVERLERAIKDLKVGVGTDDGVDIGPLINDDAVEKVQKHIADAKEHGGTVRVGGSLKKMGSGLADRFFEPTLIEGMTPDMLLCREETFGPVAPVARFETEHEAIDRANDTPYGLAAYFFTRDHARLWRVAEGLQYGIVGANDGMPSTAQAPFGGVKQSGLGREGGHFAMDEYTEIKYVSIGLG